MKRPDQARDGGDFARQVIVWQKRYGRHHLPWQNADDPYRVWLSEIMLQQTQVGAVVPYFERFVARFPTLHDLARAEEDAVLALWSGLGYYARARNLHRAARHIVQHHAGRFPRRFDDILALPGVGRSTAGAIAVFGYGQRYPILDGNVKRVLARRFGIEGYPGERRVSERLWALAEQLLPDRGVQPYTQGLMDLGAQVCTRSLPRCELCPVALECVARSEERVRELPAARPKKQRPQRATIMLIMAHDDAILMEKRPPAGIWGGLWCFPEAGDAEQVAPLCRSEYGVEVQAIDRLEPIEHGFTHFSLTISPLYCRVSRPELRAQKPGRAWVAQEQISGYAIPVPVRTILSRLQSGAAGRPLDQATD